VEAFRPVATHALAVGFARQVNPELRFFFTSALTGEGMAEWYDFLRAAANGAEAVTG